MGNGVSGEGRLGKDKSEGKGRSKMYPSSWLEDSSDSNHPYHAKEFVLLNCDAREDSWESLEQQGDQASQSLKKSVWKDSLKLKLQYFCHLMQTADSLEKTLMLQKIEGRWRREQ